MSWRVEILYVVSLDETMQSVKMSYVNVLPFSRYSTFTEFPPSAYVEAVLANVAHVI